MYAAIERFNEQYNGDKNKKKDDFCNKDEYKTYKKDLKELKAADKDFTTAYSNYQHTQQSIDNFASIDPENFAIVDNLTYTNKAGEAQNLDVVVSTDNYANQYGGGATVSTTTSDGNIIDNKIYTFISPSVDVRSDVLAHEFGHGVAIANDPLVYREAYIANPQNNCKDPIKRNAILSGLAVEWERRYIKKRAGRI
jgi:hypothetical protein